MRALFSFSFAGCSVLVLLVGCNPAINCGDPMFRYEESLDECVCADDSLRLEMVDGRSTCVCPGTLLPPGEAGTCGMDGGVDAGFDAGDAGPGDAGCPDTVWYRDADGDGFGVDIETTMGGCSAPTGFADNTDDCDDECMACRPFGTEVCDELDNDCDESVDEALPQVTCYRDLDGDGFGVEANTMMACGCFEGWTERDDAFDCGEMNPDAYPGQTAYFDEPYCEAPEGEPCLIMDFDGDGRNDVGSFDYNCDDELVEETYDGTLNCNDDHPDCTAFVTRPAGSNTFECGKSITVRECQPVASRTCLEVSVPVVQRCR